MGLLDCGAGGIVSETAEMLGNSITNIIQKDRRTFSRVYSLGKPLGSGAYSVVRECTNKKTKAVFAVKVVTKSKLSVADDAALKDEIDILKNLEHENIIYLKDDFTERSHYYLVTEIMRGGELFDRIVAKTFYNEKEARDLCKTVFEAVAYCHSLNIAHRDLKPENLLLMTKDNDRDVKLADFGFAKRVTSEECLITQCGTPGYVAPEVLSHLQYGTKADVWSLGVIAYILIGGYPPFMEQNQKVLFRKIKRGDYEFHTEYWGQTSQDVQNFIRSLLTVDPRQRLTCKQALEHTWVMQDDDLLKTNDLGNNLEKLKRFNAIRKLRQAILTLMATNKMTSLGYKFRQNLKG